MPTVETLVDRDGLVAWYTRTRDRSRAIFDLLYQLLGIVSDLVPVALVCFLLWSTARPHLGRLGIDYPSETPWLIGDNTDRSPTEAPQARVHAGTPALIDLEG